MGARALPPPYQTDMGNQSPPGKTAASTNAATIEVFMGRTRRRCVAACACLLSRLKTPGGTKAE
jgi:hypothetical protein